MKSKNTKGILILAILIMIPVLIGFFSQIVSTSLSSVPFKETYAKLNQPSFSPPSWVFGPGLDNALHTDGNIDVSCL